VRRADKLGNQLLNASFEFHRSTSVGQPFLGWQVNSFRGQPLAVGWRKPVEQSDSATALELALTDASAASEQVGLLQPCGKLRSADKWLEVQADINVPQDLKDTYGWVGAVFQDTSGSATYRGLPLKAATSGWEHYALSAPIDLPAGPYYCVAIIELIAERPIIGELNTARFDNVVVRIGESPASASNR
jgi:hypothetical protein